MTVEKAEIKRSLLELGQQALDQATQMSKSKSQGREKISKVKGSDIAKAGAAAKSVLRDMFGQGSISRII